VAIAEAPPAVAATQAVATQAVDTQAVDIQAVAHPTAEEDRKLFRYILRAA